MVDSPIISLLLAQLRSLVLLNCGGSIDLFDLFSLDVHQHLTVYVADSHRPYYQANIDNKQQVIFAVLLLKLAGLVHSFLESSISC